MRNVALAFCAVTLSLCFGLLPLQMVNSARTFPEPQTLRPVVSTQARGAEIVSADISDSDEFFQRTVRTATPERDNTQKIEALLKRMTLEEKIGQMTQLTISMIATGSDQNIKIDPDKLEKAIVKYGVGSILNVADQALTVDRWQEIIAQIQEAATKKTRLGIPVIYGIDSIHGANYVQGATLFPQEIGMAATWNPAANRFGHVFGKPSVKILISQKSWALPSFEGWKDLTLRRRITLPPV